MQPPTHRNIVIACTAASYSIFPVNIINQHLNPEDHPFTCALENRVTSTNSLVSLGRTIVPDEEFPALFDREFPLQSSTPSTPESTPEGATA